MKILRNNCTYLTAPMKPGYQTGDDQNWFLPTRASIDYMHGLNNENKKIARYAVNLSKILYIPEKIPKEINRNNVLKNIIIREETLSRFLDPSRKLISVDYMLNVINAASVGAINKFLSCIEKTDAKLFKNPGKIKNIIRKHYIDEYWIEKGIDNEELRRQIKWSLNKNVSYRLIKTPTEDFEFSQSSDGLSNDSEQDKENNPSNADISKRFRPFQNNRREKNYDLWEKSLLITVDWLYGLDRYYSDNPQKNSGKGEKDKFELLLARIKCLITFPEGWLDFITKGKSSIPCEKYNGFKGFEIVSIEKSKTFDNLMKFSKSETAGHSNSKKRVNDGIPAEALREEKVAKENIKSENEDEDGDGENEQKKKKKKKDRDYDKENDKENKKSKKYKRFKTESVF